MQEIKCDALHELVPNAEKRQSKGQPKCHCNYLKCNRTSTSEMCFFQSVCMAFKLLFGV